MEHRRKRLIFAGIAIVLLAGVAAFLLFREVTEANERTLQDQLLTLRAAIDQYILDHHRPPKSSDHIVAAGYLKALPTDPFTGRSDTWVWQESGELGEPGIVDVRSGSNKKSRRGDRYSEW